MRSFAGAQDDNCARERAGGKQGRFEQELTVLRRIHAKRPCFPPQSIKSNNVILSEAKDLPLCYCEIIKAIIIYRNTANIYV
jgi:hypothetical protein